MVLMLAAMQCFLDLTDAVSLGIAHQQQTQCWHHEGHLEELHWASSQQVAHTGRLSS